MVRAQATPRRRRLAVPCCCAAATVAALLPGLAFWSSPGPRPRGASAAAGEDASSRRSAISAIATAASAPQVLPLLGTQPAEAAEKKEPEPFLTVSGIPAAHEGANGVWKLEAGKKLNDRPVYKREGADLYLMVNDCGEFQLNPKVMGDCKGFARQVGKGKWNVDGKDISGQVKVKKGQFLKGAKVEVATQFMSDDETPIKLEKGRKGVVSIIDEEGDIGFLFAGDKDVNWVMKENFDKVKRL